MIEIIKLIPLYCSLLAPLPVEIVESHQRACQTQLLTCLLEDSPERWESERDQVELLRDCLTMKEGE